MTQPLVLYELFDSAAKITLHRPERRNALSRELIDALREAFDRAKQAPKVRSVVLTGSGSAFCAGMDLQELRRLVSGQASATEVHADAELLAQLYDEIYHFPKPTVAAVNGPAIAGGAGLVSVCDLAYAMPDASFGYPEVRRGLVAAMVMPHLLRHVNQRAARWLLLTGELIDAHQAERWGLINRVVPRDTFWESIRAVLRSLADGAPQALKATKELLGRCAPQALSSQELAQASAAPRLSDECREGLSAFFNKTSPSWAPHS